MKTEDIQALATQAARRCSITELDEHLGYDKHDKAATGNSHNGYSSKTFQTEDGQFKLQTPRDRNNDFEPYIII